MRLLLASVGQRPPAWAEAAYDDFAKRFPPELKLELKAVKAEPRTSGKTAAQLMAAEAQRLEAAEADARSANAAVQARRLADEATAQRGDAVHKAKAKVQKKIIIKSKTK